MPKKDSLSHAIRDGGRFYFDNPTVDQLLAMVLTLSGQLWAMRERLAALESVLAHKGTVATGEVEGHDFTDAEELELAALRKELLASLFGILEVQAPIPAARATQPAARAKKGTRGASRASKARASKHRPAKNGRKARRSRR
jgi:hypothetical protein